MLDIDILTPETAPESARETLNAVKGKYGFIPNVLGAMAHSPTAVKGYVTLSGLLGESSLKPHEVQLVLLSASIANGCEYCVPAHSTVGKMAGLTDAQVTALRSGAPLDDPRLNALAAFTRTVVNTRGQPGEGDIKAFFDAGFDKVGIFDVLTAIAVKTMSNYVNHMFDVPVDEAFKANAWSKSAFKGAA